LTPPSTGSDHSADSAVPLLLLATFVSAEFNCRPA
jgi:hypothetical protein